MIHLVDPKLMHNARTCVFNPVNAHLSLSNGLPSGDKQKPNAFEQDNVGKRHFLCCTDGRSAIAILFRVCASFAHSCRFAIRDEIQGATPSFAPPRSMAAFLRIEELEMSRSQGLHCALRGLGNAQVSGQNLGLQRCCAAGISTHDKAADLKEHRPLLVRDYIYSALYEPRLGYFTAKADAVGAIPEPIWFDRIQGRGAYNEYLSQLYKQHDISWFTPVEVFQPWYGYAVAEYILRTMDPSAPLKIYEVGGGTGTCANNILTYFKLRAPSVYKTMTYTSVEISAALARKQKARVEAVKSHSGHFMVNCGSASDPRTWGTANADPCYVVMFEVLDNLPHDLVYRETPKSPWLETWVVQKQTGSSLVEERRPLQDPLVKRCLDAVAAVPETVSLVAAAKSSLSKLLNFSELSWMPTGCLKLLETLHRVRPNMALITSDFSSLPDVTISGARAPIVASKENGETKDHSSYLQAMGNADIFFPTDFQLLERLDHYAATGSADINTSERISTVVTSAEFMEQCAQVDKTRTLDGYNPLLEDYSNTKFYISLPSL